MIGGIRYRCLWLCSEWAIILMWWCESRVIMDSSGRIKPSQSGGEIDLKVIY